MSVTQTPEVITAADGYRLRATRFRSAGPTHSVLLVAGATAVPQRFYRRFAVAAAERGFETVTLDYRGIGESAPPSLRGFRMDFTDWARLDLAAAVDAITVDDRPLFVAGHSYGAVCFALLPGHERVAGVYAFGAGAGWHGWMPRLERLRVLALWNIIGPVATTALGYLPWSRLMSGEDLPRDVFWQWRRWCARPHFLLDDDRLPGIRDEYARVTTPMVLSNSTDDRWAPPRSRDAIMTGYSSAPWVAADVSPAQLGLDAIGHMGYFRPDAAELWSRAFEWFDGVRREPAPR